MSRNAQAWRFSVLATLAGTIALAGDAMSWRSVPATVRIAGDDTHISFQPRRVSMIRLEGVKTAPDSVRVWGVSGRCIPQGIRECPTGTEIFPGLFGPVAEIVLSGIRAPELKVKEFAPAAPPPPTDSDMSVWKAYGDFQVTFYWMVLEEDSPGLPADQELQDEKGRKVATVCRPFAEGLRREGCGRLADGRVVQFIPDSGRVEIVSCPYGLGTAGHHLIPFRSVAVDPAVIQIGTELRIPAARGALLPDGTIHDGAFWAQDVGSAIRGRKIDVFTGAGDQRALFEKAGVKNLESTPVFKFMIKLDDPPVLKKGD